MERIRRDDGWYSDNGGMAWHHPAPYASVPLAPAPGSSFTMDFVVPRVIENPIEPHLAAIRSEYSRLDQQHSLCSISIDSLRKELTELKLQVETHKSLVESYKERLKKIRGHLNES